MRSHHLIAIAAVILVGIGIKVLFFPSLPAEAQPPATNSGMDIFKMHMEYPNIKDLPDQRVDEPV
jgi:hypothetical protein